MSVSDMTGSPLPLFQHGPISGNYHAAIPRDIRSVEQHELLNAKYKN